MIMSPQPKAQKEGVLSRLHEFWRNEGGATAIAMGLMSPVIIGGMALGGETGYWYYTQRKLQHAADMAAYAAAVRKRAGDSGNQLDTAAIRVASASGFRPIMVDVDPDPSSTQWIAVNLVVNNPPQSGGMVGNHQAFELLLSETKPRLLSSIFSKEPIRIKARAVAKLSEGSPACVLSLSNTRSKAVEVSGSTEVTLNDCSIAANSIQDDAYYMPNSSAKLSAECISTVGGASIKDGTSDVLQLECKVAQEHAPLTPDPYADVPEPIFPLSGCLTQTKFSGNIPAPTKTSAYGNYECFANGIKIEANNTANFPPGLYIITGGTLSVEDKAVMNSTGATFFFMNNTTAQISGQAKLNLVAPSTGIFAGLVFFSQRCDATLGSCDEVFKITGGSDFNVKGAIYLPGSTVEFLGNAGSATSCLQIIGDKVTFTGNSEIQMGSACSGVGTKEVRVGQIVTLVE